MNDRIINGCFLKVLNPKGHVVQKPEIFGENYSGRLTVWSEMGIFKTSSPSNSTRRSRVALRRFLELVPIWIIAENMQHSPYKPSTE